MSHRSEEVKAPLVVALTTHVLFCWRAANPHRSELRLGRPDKCSRPSNRPQVVGLQNCTFPDKATPTRNACGNALDRISCIAYQVSTRRSSIGHARRARANLTAPAHDFRASSWTMSRQRHRGADKCWINGLLDLYLCVPIFCR